MQDIGSGIAYDYGIDPQGKMYIWDKWDNKMVYYGDPKAGYNQILALSTGNGAKVNFQGDKTNGAWKTAAAPAPASNTGGGGSGYATPAKVLDQAQIDALNSLLGNYDTTYEIAKKKAALKRDASTNEKQSEFAGEKKKYEGNKLTTLQDFAGAKTGTDINTRNTIENLISSLSTMGLGGSRALTRQILDAANQSNRKANETQAKNNQSLDTSFNDYQSGYENDLKKIADQFGYDTGEAQRQWAQDRQNAFYKMADVYNAADIADKRQELMNKGNSLNSLIANSAFVNPQYTGVKREIATPELGSYTQNIAQYDTSNVGAPTGAPGSAPVASGMTPVRPGVAAPGNMAIRAIALNNKDFGVKKKTEGNVAYGV